VQKAIGSQLTCVFVDHGLLRSGETQQVEKDFVGATGVSLKTINAKKQFLDALKDVSDPETKRKIIGREFIRAFEQAAREIVDESENDVEFLVQGTLYPDVVESGGGTGTANIKVIITSAACRTTCSSNSSNPFERFSKTKSAKSAKNLACRTI